MAESDQDQSQKTEEPTQRRLDDAREKGEVASSREVAHWFILMAGAVAMAAAVPSSAARLSEALGALLDDAAARAVDLPGLMVLLRLVTLEAGVALAPVFGLLIVAAMAAGLVQHGPLFSPDAIQPKLERLSLLKGVERLFSLRSLVELGKGVAKLAIVALVVGMVLWPDLGQMIDSVTLEPARGVRLLGDMASQLMFATVAVMAVVAAADLLFQKLQHHRRLRMSRQDIRDEFKQTEGDPMIKGRLRQLRLERSRRRMMAAVPHADVVVTNPTHFAVALKYEAAVMPAPKVVAKGADRIALRIREIAAEHKVPIVENPLLARALHDSVDIDQFVPERHYKAVAEVIGYVMRLKGKLPRRPGPRPGPASGPAGSGPAGPA